MATSKQTKQTTTEDNFLFAINSQEGEMIVKIGANGEILYLKEDISMQEAAKAFWNSFQLFLPVTAEEVMGMPNDADLGAHIRARLHNKLGI